MRLFDAKRLVALGLTVGLLILASALIAADTPGVKIKGWGQVVDPDGDCEVTAKDGAVTFKMPTKPHDFANELKVQNSPRVLSEIKGDFIAEVLVSGEFKPGQRSTLDLQPDQQRTPYHGAGLLLIKDDSTYLTMARACLRRDDMLRHYANFELRSGGTIAEERFNIDLPPDKDLWLRLERRNNAFLASISVDRANWTSYEAINVDMPETLKIGIVGVNTSDTPLSLKFDKLAIFKKVEVE